jgi:hypothetical protein
MVNWKAIAQSRPASPTCASDRRPFCCPLFPRPFHVSNETEGDCDCGAAFFSLTGGGAAEPKDERTEKELLSGS